MIKIGTPNISLDNDYATLTNDIIIDGRCEKLWFKVSSEYAKYLTTERADAYLVLLFYYAMKHGHDMEFEVPVSERIYYQMKYYLIDALNQEDPSFKNIQIQCTTECEPVVSENAVGTGMSGGIDSLSTIYLHTGEDCPQSYKLTHLTFFNSGAAHLPDGERVLDKSGEDIFQKRVELAKTFAERTGLKLLVVDSNISELLKIDHTLTHTYRNCGTALLFQKLFSVYYYSSAGVKYSTNYVSPNLDTGHYDDSIVPYISNNNITFYSTIIQYTRFRKTKILTDYNLSYEFLNVCITDSTNCGECSKCIRTLTTLDALGRLDRYRSVFDLEKYQKNRNRHIGWVVVNRKKDFYDEIYQCFKDNKKHIPFVSVLHALNYWVIGIIKKNIPQGIKDSIRKIIRK
ncbi:MAG: hypothetical protein BWY15_01202 [Firmicutes bacterium ADurb.Bin193]|nr:MAG: hypothetical protein BWY15_01202 [Firmicutes bacterium ADurb.Bin193]